MKRSLLIVFLLTSAGSAVPAFAKDFYFGEETKGVTFTQGESDLTVRIRFQPRLDAGDIIEDRDGTAYESSSDLYLRRIRLEMTGNLLSKQIRYNLTLDGDKWEKTGNTNKVSVKYVWLTWEPAEAYSFFIGKFKLPFSRDFLTSDSTHLFVEATASGDAGKNIFGATNAYFQPKASIFGRFFDGAIAYEASVADGWQTGETIETGRTVFKAQPLLAVRTDLSLPGWVEKKKTGSYLGKGQHLTLGTSFARQGAIEYQENGFDEERTLWEADLSGHYKGLTATVEYINWKMESSDPAIAKKNPLGWYAQAGYFIEGLNIEPVARYEVYDQDSEASDKKEKSTTLGVNWYGKGHSLKLQADWVHTEYEPNATGKLANADSKDVVQLQGQLYF
ncbi:MAG TPA: hypothetical protein DDW94_07315 [Deltaproteobacteria bacterium]|nr:MAG: hypothetical protein A2Z79_01845 [Deltaproteobacteria bacterium GWA2_55_82]OGQ62575.1 MAG: hypothetical protein A3I81_08660 [Deltaproteobacteria bacterium RIFCSPLOWO2_02_FULL_55_12]OIJ74163.1 MAG: hypothetical protein A2V21_307745 [Deltaproteobacteria bacterium GWC2_55_46]HBG46784.1 hypothetical protein [Deltaproteobacteria bacterium]HCY11207.1 hypothetical protein [Deltaproteobacteria bacterium]